MVLVDGDRFLFAIDRSLGGGTDGSSHRQCADRAILWDDQAEGDYLGNYPDEISAREEIGRNLERYHHSRPHQSLINFTPAHVHEVNNKSRLLAELQEINEGPGKPKSVLSTKPKSGLTSVCGGMSR